MVSIYYDGTKKVFATEAPTVADAVALSGIEVAPDDLLEPKGNTSITPTFFSINIYRARPVVIIDQGQEYKVNSAHRSPRLVAAAAGLETYPEDVFETNIISNIVSHKTIGEIITVDRAAKVSVTADGKTEQYRTQGTTIQDFFIEKAIALGAKDTVVPGVHSAISDGLSIKITRVKVADVTIVESLKRAVQSIKDPELEYAYRQTKQEGSDGRRTVTYRISYNDGREVGRQTLKVEGELAPVPKVIAVGSKITSNTWRKLRECEVGGDWYATDTKNGYYGAYQFNVGTWWGLGYGGYPHQADAATQDEAARRLQARDGWNPWPVCARKLGYI